MRGTCQTSMAAQQDNRNEIAQDQEDQQQVPGNQEEDGTGTDQIPDLLVPDLDNTHLADAIANGMALNDRRTECIICCPRLKPHIGTDKLKVSIPSGELAVYTKPPVRFVANCAPIPFK